MKTVKKVLSVLLIFGCISAMILPTFATEIQPLTDNANKAVTSFSIDSSGTATCQVRMTAYDRSYKIYAVMTISRVSGSSPGYVNSWHVGGSNALWETKTCTVTPGFTYKLTTDITIKDASGNVLESFQGETRYA